MKKSKKSSRKFILLEVETTLSNIELENHARDQVDTPSVNQPEWGRDVLVIQVHVNAAKKEPKQ